MSTNKTLFGYNTIDNKKKRLSSIESHFITHKVPKISSDIVIK